MSSQKHHALYHLRILFPCVALAAMLMGAVAMADGPAEAATDPEKAGPDFALQGEYLGSVLVSESEARALALQIRMNEEGDFEAAQILGGLPSHRPNSEEPVRLVGRRSGDFAVLSGGDWVVLVHPNHCVLVDPEGKCAGRLERVRRTSPTLGAKAPEQALVLFDGTNTEQFSPGEMTEDGLLIQGADFKPLFQDFNLHLEFKLPYMPVSAGQGRSNSGVYLQSRYEVQILDSFGIDPGFNGCGSLYRFRAPDVNMCLPPLSWQTYDIIFTAARWNADGTKRKNARITVWLNGVKVHDNVELPNKTGAGKVEEPTLLPIRLQDHGNPVRFQNIWAIDRGEAPTAKFPVSGPEAK